LILDQTVIKKLKIKKKKKKKKKKVGN